MTFLAESPLSCFEEWGTLRVGWVVDKRAEYLCKKSIV